MVSIASVQRTIAVMAVMLALCVAEWVLLAHGPQLGLGLSGRVLVVVSAFAVLGLAGKLTAWERRRRREDEAAVQRVVDAARSVGVDVLEDRAIFPIIFRDPVKRSA
jgi:hypothetical protein